MIWQLLDVEIGDVLVNWIFVVVQKHVHALVVWLVEKLPWYCNLVHSYAEKVIQHCLVGMSCDERSYHVHTAIQDNKDHLLLLSLVNFHLLHLALQGLQGLFSLLSFGNYVSDLTDLIGQFQQIVVHASQSFQLAAVLRQLLRDDPWCQRYGSKVE